MKRLWLITMLVMPLCNVAVGKDGGTSELSVPRARLKATAKERKVKDKDGKDLFTEFHFDQVSIGGKINEPMVEFVKSGERDGDHGFIKIREEFRDEMIGSADHLKFGGPDALWEPVAR